MLRMASTEPGDERSEVLWHSAQLERYRRATEGMSPSPRSEVALHIGASHVLDDLSAIEPLAGEWRQLAPGGASVSACTRQPPPCHSANPADKKRITIEFSHISAHVPLLFQQPSLLKKLNPLALRHRISQIGSGKLKPTHRQVCRRDSGTVASLPGPAKAPAASAALRLSHFCVLRLPADSV